MIKNENELRFEIENLKEQIKNLHDNYKIAVTKIKEQFDFLMDAKNQTNATLQKQLSRYDNSTILNKIEQAEERNNNLRKTNKELIEKNAQLEETIARYHELYGDLNDT